jgi:hypothetical protein
VIQFKLATAKPSLDAAQSISLGDHSTLLSRTGILQT